VSENGSRCRLEKEPPNHHFPGGSGLGPRCLCRDYYLHTIGDDRCTRAGSAVNNFDQIMAVEGVLRHVVSLVFLSRDSCKLNTT
jgi:hypothetical protein